MVKRPTSRAGEPGDDDFQVVLKTLLAAYRPVLEEDLKRAEDPEAIAKDADAPPPGLDEEIALANRIFERFFTEESAIRTLPPEARRQLDAAGNWRWCLGLIRCCLIFGWLLCRRPCTFRAYIEALYRYWICVRQALGTPVSTPPTAAERQDFEILVEAFAGAYKPHLTNQLASVDFPAGLPDEAFAGKLGEGGDDPIETLERLLNVNIAPALLGKAAFETHSQDPFFWFCRCWCLCAIRFGCCLARAHNSVDLARCLRFYIGCLRDCFRPLTCTLTDPHGCVAEEANPGLGAFVVEIKGTAAGLGFDHYILEWSVDDTIYHAADFIYPPIPPGTAVQGNAPVVAGLLAYFNTTYLDPDHYFIRMTVFSATAALPPCKIAFDLFKKDVRILGVDGYSTMDTGWGDPAAQLIENVPALCARIAGTYEVSFGGCLSVQGGAFVGGCEGKQIKRYLIDYKPGFETNCSTPGWTNVWHVEYNTPAQKRFINRRTDFSTLTSVWGPDCFLPSFIPPLCWPFIKSVPNSLLYPSCWNSTSQIPCPNSGLYTLRLIVEATDGSTYCDTQRVWIDNKHPCAMIRVDGVKKCADLFISQFANPPDCKNAWPVELTGIAFDPLIDETALPTRPNFNFDYYEIHLKKQGGPEVTIPIPIADPVSPCFHGIAPVGDPSPGTSHCPPCNPYGLPPSAVIGTLAKFDLRILDPKCTSDAGWSVPPDLLLPRGECCVYIFKLWVYDRTFRGGAQHNAPAYDDWPVKICNDLT
jgi:hypothetical protein